MRPDESHDCHNNREENDNLVDLSAYYRNEATRIHKLILTMTERAHALRQVDTGSKPHTCSHIKYCQSYTANCEHV